ncbi:MAG TPA: GNAT family protein [Pyrinomonadaceae bacterium]|nr:GNAT family N-acetyltransferase [Chloracidobacterium sp.]MBP9936779.1 GNAT family N-acetyltransferase [Pyrinomonadaceae bacterium]MBK7802716.1 GNAT family N-acetyltransferase [Chloracidobacterium sp.]MBK9437570.1 GNAT family N-acetyltransferase [Chloracidobacterium sp.]MBL0240236.1 GNAT family N-acetyltransferase [Chloracidobacterium sp.]
MKVESVPIIGDNVKLEPLRVDHIPALCDVGLDGQLWKWTTSVIANALDMERYVKRALVERDLGASVPYVTVVKNSGMIVGATRFGNIDVANRKAEIGWTWVTPKWQRTSVNTETKLLMLSHAFEQWKCIRVEFKTDANNRRSRKAIKRLGAKEEGILRNHMITESGRFRDSVYFSIIENEWDAVKQRLCRRLEKRDED